MADELKSELLKKIRKEGTRSAFFDNLLSTLLNTFPDHIYLKDTNSRFILINESLQTLFKLSKSEDAVGKTDFDFFTVEHAQRAFDDEQSIMKDGIGRSNFIEEETWPDGSVSWVASTKVPFSDEQGNIIGLFGISRDITVRKNIEKELGNRARELQCFIEISRITGKKNLSSEGYIHKINELISQHFSHVSICSSRVIIGNKAIKNKNFKQTEFVKKYRILENQIKVGILEVYCTKDVREKENKFPDETNQVLKLIAGRISETIEKKWIEKNQRKWEHILHDVENHMDLFP